MQGDPGPAGPAGVGFRASYDFEEGKGTSSADASGSGNTLKLNGASFDKGHTGFGLLLDGKGAFAEAAFSPSLALREELTVSAWVFQASNRELASAIVSREGQFSLAIVNGQAQLQLQTVSGLSPYTGAGLVPFAAWTHVMATYDGLAVRIYVNGVITSLTPFARGVLSKSDRPLRLGNRTSEGKDIEPFAGVLDEVRVLGLATPRRTPSVAIHTPDTRPGCPPAASSGALVVTPLTLSQDSNVSLSGHMVSNAKGGRELDLVVDKTVVARSFCRTEILDFCEHQLHWNGRLVAGQHNVSLTPFGADVAMGCGPDWGAIDALVPGD